MVIKSCDFCKNQIESKNKFQKYCSKSCRQKAYYYRNHSKILEKEKIKYSKNKNKKKEYSKKYYLINKKEISVKKKTYRENNKEEISIKQKRHHQKNKHLKKISKFKRRTKIKEGKISITKEKYNKLLNRYKFCIYCNIKLTNETKSIDHIIPLSKNGSNLYENLTLCCSTCNKSKGNKDLIDWANKKKINLNKEILKQYYSLRKNPKIAEY